MRKAIIESLITANAFVHMLLHWLYQCLSRSSHQRSEDLSQLENFERARCTTK